MRSPRIMVVGEAWGEHEEREGKPFQGPAGGMLRGLLSQVGIEKGDVYMTNVFNLRPPNNEIDKLCTRSAAEAIPHYRPIKASPKLFIHQDYEPEIERLFEELERINPNVVIALGNTALWALTKKVGIKRYRGSPLPTHDSRWKVIPTWHPAAILRQFTLRVVTLADLTKAKREAEFPEIRRPTRYIYMEPTLEDIGEFYRKHLKDEPFVSVDTETKNNQITEVGIGDAEGRHAIVIPFWDRETDDGNYWPTLEDELEAWSWVRYIIREKALIGQNFQYDAQYFWRTVRMGCPHWMGDTMILHHSLQPEMEKSLGFLGSIYTDEPSWKFMRTDHSTMKREDD